MSRAERNAWIVGVIGLAGALIGWMVAPRAFAFAWVAGLSFWIGWPLGSMGLLLVHALTGGRWGEAVQPALVGGALALPLLLPALLPLLLSLPALYPWLHADVAAHLGNHFYLNGPFFAGRGAFYLIAWFGLAGLILRALRGGRSLARLAPAGLILLALTVTFAAIDLTMSLDPDFNSSIYGMIALASGGLLALTIAVLFSAADRHATDDLGRLLLGICVLWAYLDFMQLLIVWESDLPKEALWYIRRSSGVWAYVAMLIALLHFVLPFALLLSPQLRRTRGGIGLVAALLITGEGLRAWWLVLPAVPRGIGLVDLAAMLAFAGCGVALALRLAPVPLGVRHG